MDDKPGKKSAFTLSVDEALKNFSSKTEGLSAEEAGSRLKKHGPNKLEEKKQKSLLHLAIDQLKNPIIYLLAVAVVVSFIFNDIPEAIAILVVIIFNTMIGFWMEYQARKSVDSLKKLDQLQTHVRRGNKSQKINAEELVPGDIILLEPGDLVPADARVINASELRADESPLTGESVPVEKNEAPLDEKTPLADRSNMLFKGTAVTSGKAEAVVTATGGNTEIGKVSKMVNEAEEDEIPLNKKLGKLSHNLIWVILVLAAVFFVFGWISGKELYLLLQTSIAWTVAAIPEGLPIVASIALARGMLRLARRNVIVKKLEAVETLGETTVIFTDKTGTLTENKLTVSQLIYPGKELQVENKGEKNEIAVQPEDYKEDDNFQHLYKISIFCNDAEWLNDNELKGDPLDASLLRFAKAIQHKKYQELAKLKKLHEDPFDSEAKFMGSIHEMKAVLYISAKGAAEPILKRSEKYLENGEVKTLDEKIRQEWLDKNHKLSEQGLRVIAYAFREENLQQKEKLSASDDFVDKMTFAGFVGFIDPAREDIRLAMEKCHRAGIKVVMVTGDHPGIAQNIAEKVQMNGKGQRKVIEGKNLENNTQSISDSSVFARVDPKQKLDIIDHYKKQGEITAMTGDGVNDAPALKKADIGIAMGKRGTQVAQDVADMVLKDDSFASIVDAIEQGRIIFGNIRKFVIYQLSYHLAEIIIIAGISFTLFNLPLLPLQLLFLNLLSDVFPALALGLGKGDSTIMQQKPKDPEEPIITRKNWMATFTYGIIMAVIITAAYFTALKIFGESKETANTITFFSLAISQLLHVFNMRDHNEKLFNNQVTRNIYVWIALTVCTAFLLAGYFVPLFNEVLSFEKLTPANWALAGITSVATLMVIQVAKKVFRI